MGDNKYDLFYNNICSANFTSSVYNGWGEADLANLSSSSRTIYYDSNIAFTSGDKSVVSSTTGDGSLLAVPDLYGTLKGLNDRINFVSANIGNAGSEVSSADAYLYVTKDSNEHIISPGNNDDSITVATGSADCPISLKGPDTAKFTVNGDDFAFTVDGNTITLKNLLEMVEELRARTALIKSDIKRCFVTDEPYFPYSSTKFGVNTLQPEPN